MADSTYKRSRRASPEPHPADGMAKELRERAADAFAKATIHAQKLTRFGGKKTGITPDVVSGVGDRLYGMTVQQLDLALAVLEGSQKLADRLLDALDLCEKPVPLLALEVAQGAPLRRVVVVTNDGAKRGKLRFASQPPCGVQLMKDVLDPRERTTALLSFDTTQRGRFEGSVAFSIRAERIARVDYELWVD